MSFQLCYFKFFAHLLQNHAKVCDVVVTIKCELIKFSFARTGRQAVKAKISMNRSECFIEQMFVEKECMVRLESIFFGGFVGGHEESDTRETRHFNAVSR